MKRDRFNAGIRKLSFVCTAHRKKTHQKAPSDRKNTHVLEFCVLLTVHLWYDSRYMTNLMYNYVI